MSRVARKNGAAEVIQVDFSAEGRVPDFITSNGQKVEMAPTAQIDNFDLERAEFVSVILGRTAVFMSDETILLDFCPSRDSAATWLQRISKEIEVHYGVGAAPHLTGPIWQIFADIRNHRRQNFLRQT
jgi:hypothetical protein